MKHQIKIVALLASALLVGGCGAMGSGSQASAEGEQGFGLGRMLGETVGGQVGGDNSFIGSMVGGEVGSRASTPASNGN